MSTVLPNMGLKQPTQGDAGAGLWDDDWDDNAEAIDAHDHTTGKGVRVPTAGININADLTFSSLYAPINLHRITFASIVALTSSNKSLFVSSSDNELYWRSNAGTNVKLTSGSALNVAAFTGGIGGDYAAVGAAVAYDDSADRYTFKQQSGTWARLACGPVRLFEFNTSESVYVEHAVAAGLGASYTVTWPAVLPADTRPMNISSAGAVAFSDAHGDRVLELSGVAFVGAVAYTSGPAKATSSGAGNAFLSVPLKQGDRIKSIVFALFGDGAADITALTVVKQTAAAGDTTIGTTTVTNPPAAWNDTTIDVTDTTLAAGEAIAVVVAFNAANISFGTVRVTYDHP